MRNLARLQRQQASISILIVGATSIDAIRRKERSETGWKPMLALSKTDLMKLPWFDVCPRQTLLSSFD
jgi:actin-related protein